MRVARALKLMRQFGTITEYDHADEFDEFPLGIHKTATLILPQGIVRIWWRDLDVEDVESVKNKDYNPDETSVARAIARVLHRGGDYKIEPWGRILTIENWYAMGGYVLGPNMEVHRYSGGFVENGEHTWLLVKDPVSRDLVSCAARGDKDAAMVLMDRFVDGILEFEKWSDS